MVLKYELLTAAHPLWETVQKYAAACSWSAGKSLAEKMANHAFADWERVVVVLQGMQVCGYCTITGQDCIPNLPYTPYVGYIFVGETFRGQRLSEKMIQCAKRYLKQLGYHAMYIISDHEALYEKYGFCVIDRAVAPWGSVEKIYRREI